MFLHQTIGGPVFRVSGQTSSTNTWRPCVPNYKLLEGPVFRVYRDTDRRAPPNSWRPCVLAKLLEGPVLRV